MLKFLGIACLCLSGVGCGGARATSANEAVAEYVAAVEADDPQRAYALLAKDVRAKLSFEKFAADWKKSAKERAMQKAELQETQRLEPELGTRAVIKYRTGNEISLSRFQRRWYVETALLADTTSVTPRDTIIALSKALHSVDVRNVLALLSSARRDAIAGQLDAFAASLATHQEHFIHRVNDDRAEMVWEDDSGRYRIVLIREESRWRIDDLHIEPTPKSDDSDEEKELKPVRGRR